MENPAFEFSVKNCDDAKFPAEQDYYSTNINSLAPPLNINRKLSRDTTPHIDNYRTGNNIEKSSSRPTLTELCDPTDHAAERQESFEETATDLTHQQDDPKVEKFGWIEGVLIRNMMSLWGVMLFLRLSWVVGQAGIGETLIIIAISTFITLVTALSMSAISTNGEIGGGGTYFVMSRILGPEFGGSIGIIFTVANILDCAINVVGFSSAVKDMMFEYGGVIIVDGGINDIRIIGIASLIFVGSICGLGAQYETKMKDAMFVILLIAISNFVIGSIMGPSSELEEAKGFIGYRLSLLNENWGPSYTVTDGQMQNFISIFAVYFPSNIGILAGANASGNLKNPNKAIPKGTILAIILCSLSYAGIAIICAATVSRTATGIVEDLQNGTNLNCNVTEPCIYGLSYDYQVMALVSAFAPLNYVGCFAATLSSALTDFFSCVALLQVIAADNLYPYWLIGFLGKEYGASKTPFRCYACTFIIASAFILIAKLDVIALLISNFFLATFALMNFSTFHVSLIKPIGWRPTFKYYNTWLSLLTGLLAIAAMMLISIPVAIITIAVVIFFYFVVLYCKPEVNWGSSTQAQTYRIALNSIQQLAHTEEHAKNYRPQILVLTGLPNTRPALVDFAYLICKNNSLMICGHVVKERLTHEMRSKLQQKAYRYLRFTKIKGYASIVDNSDLHTGVAAMLNLSGVGKVKPNILMMGYKSDWSTCDRSSLDQYVMTIHTGFEMNAAVTILRLKEGLDCSEILADFDDAILNASNKKTKEKKDSTLDISGIENSDKFTESTDTNIQSEIKSTKDRSFKLEKKKKAEQNLPFRDTTGKPLPKSILNNIILFQSKQKKNTVDVWWLSDDGGLTLLLPVIINNRSNWSATKLRIFCTASGVSELEKDHRGMAMLLSKFRIDYSDLVIINDADEAPKEKTKKWFDGIIQPLLKPGTNGPLLTEEELEAFQYKTNRHLRLRELLLDHCSDSNLVVMTLPITRKESFSAPLYMAWLEALTANMPPFMLVRGNQTSVLTFYS